MVPGHALPHDLHSLAGPWKWYFWAAEMLRHAVHVVAKATPKLVLGLPHFFKNSIVLHDGTFILQTLFGYVFRDLA